MPTFDISSEYNQQEVVNAVDQAHREISNRYDFRETGTFISYSENTITLKSSTSERMAAAEQVLKEKFAKRNVSVKFLGEFKDETTPSEVKRFFYLKSGIDQDSSKKIIALIKENNLITLDVGGTTAKCSLIENGNVKINTNYWIEKNRQSAGYPVMLPVVDIVEIGNGGGSIAWVDNYDKLHVGPQSAGADPGPVSYGKGGTSITTTDANLITNRINQNYFCGGEIKADMDAVSKTIAPLSKKLKFTNEETARGIIRIANNNMINALKLVSVNKGYDPRDFSLVAFGGGGGMHATSLAKELNIPKVIIPVNSSVFSAWGMLMSDLRRDYILTKLTTMNDQAIDILNKTFSEMEKQAEESYKKENISKELISFKRFGSFRYLGQDHSVEIPITNSKFDEDSIKKIIDDFHTQYEKEFTYKLENQVDMIQFHLVAFAKIEKPELQERKITNIKVEDTVKETREVDFDEMGVHKSNIYNFDLLEPGMEFTGPAIVEDPSTTVVIFPKQKCKVDKFANLHISIGGENSE